MYSLFYLGTRLHIDSWTPIIMYISYTALGSLAFFFMTGAIGFIASFIFIRKIYGAVKID